MSGLAGKLKIKQKLWIIVGISLVGLVLTEAIFLGSLKNDLFEEKKMRTKSVVETAYDMVQYYYNEAKLGKLTEEEAKLRARSVVRSLRYDGNEYFWINDMNHTMLSHPFFELEGKDATNLPGDVKAIVIAFVDKVKSQKAGFVPYVWKKPNSEVLAPKVAYVKGFEPWGWVIGSGIYTYDIDTALWNKALREALLVLLVFCAIVAVSALVARSITTPLAAVRERLKRMSEGDLRLETEGPREEDYGQGTNETSQLLRALHNMRSSLDSLIGKVQLSGMQVTSSTTEIAASARELEATVGQQAASIKEVTATTKEISNTSESLAKTMEGVGDAVAESASTAESGREKLRRMELSMRDFIQATGYISTKLGVINDKANKISGIVTTINKISDQTNLLSLNAAIEAEKAGEYGKGFSVVAREITHLSDQTAIATKDIEYMVREMQSSVTSGVMEMDKFAEGVRRGVEETSSISDQLGKIIDQVKAISPQFENVTATMHYQVEGAQQISEAMTQLSAMAEHTKESLSEFKEVTEQLNSAVQVLRAEVSRFKLSHGSI